MRQRIPLAAIEKVEARGGRGAALVVTLTSDGTPPRTYAVRSRNASAVEAFAATVACSVPVRDADEPRADGSRRVVVEFLPARPKRLDAVQRRLLVGAAVWALVLAAVIADGDHTDKDVLMWLLAPLFVLPGAMCVLELWTSIRDALVLPRRGVTVVGELVDSTVNTDGDVVEYVYAFTAVDGTVHRHEGMFGGEESVEITYDPSHPDRSRVHGHAGASALKTVLIVVVGLPVFLTGAAMAFVPLAELVSGV
ncbi:hypothetical protein ACFY71_39590 [Streptomyces cinerochromogenes]|uniref:hypothetical protein n=1 Tax=Streptomyces cinerochromogenes TaxID=66422 RepID=UPI0036854C09